MKTKPSEGILFLHFSHLHSQCYFYLYKYEEAIKVFTKVLLNSPNYENTYYHLGHSYLMVNNENKAKESLDKVI